MIKKIQWTSISTITLVCISSIGLGGCEIGMPNKNDHVKQTVIQSSENTKSVMNHEMTKENQEEGADFSVDFATDDIAYLTQLGLMRGHLFVGRELYNAGHIEHAKMHMKHPKSELYADIEPAFTVRGSSGFAQELVTISNAVEDELGNEVVTNAYTVLISAIAVNEAAITKQSLLPAQQLKIVSELLRVAGEEYAIAVVDGEMQNAHEYQDALGFTTIATKIVESIKSDDSVVNNAKGEALTILAGLKPLWPSLIPPNRLKTDASALYVAAQKIELLLDIQ